MTNAFYQLAQKISRYLYTQSSSLSVKKYLWGRFVSRFFGEKVIVDKYPEIPGYTLIKGIRLQDHENPNSVGIYKSQKFGKVIIKHLQYTSDVLSLYQFQNEIHVQRLLNETRYADSDTVVQFPKVHQVIETEGQLVEVMEFVEGTVIDEMDVNTQFEAVTNSLLALQSMNTQLDENTKRQLPKRSKYFMMLSISAYFLLTLKKYPEQSVFLSKFIYLYFKYELRNLLKKTQYVLTHRALHAENIMMNDKQLTIIDPNNSMLSEEFSDLSIVARMYLSKVGKEKVKSLIHNFLSKKQDVETFIKLSIYYPIQTMAITPKTDTHHQQSFAYLHFINDYLLENPNN